MQLSAQVTTPAVEGIDGEWIESEEDPNKGFAFLYVPESQLPPHRVLLNLKDVKDHYYFRTGESFIVASHSQLEDMFGRHPKPRLNFETKLMLYSGSSRLNIVDVIIEVKNTGRGVAKLPFVAIRIHKPYSNYSILIGASRNQSFGLTKVQTSHWNNWLLYGTSSDPAIHPGVSLEVATIRIEVHLDKPRKDIEPLKIDYQLAAEGMQLVESQTTISEGNLWQIVNQS